MNIPATDHDLGGALGVVGLAGVQASVPLVHMADGEAVVIADVTPGHLVTAMIPVHIRGGHTLAHWALQHQLRPSQHQVTGPANDKNVCIERISRTDNSVALLVRELDPGFDPHHGQYPRLGDHLETLPCNTGVDA